MSRTYPDRPVVGVGVIVVSVAGVALIRRASPPEAGNWSLPGGRQELDETVREAGTREVAEETGLVTEILGVVDVVDSIHRDSGGRVLYHYTLVDLVARPVGGILRAADDAADARWFPLDEIGKLGLWSETERVIRSACERFPEALAAPLPG